jgi:hypothetical protein
MMRLLIGALFSGAAIVLAGAASFGPLVSERSAVYLALAGIAGCVAVLSSADILKKSSAKTWQVGGFYGKLDLLFQ